MRPAGRGASRCQDHRAVLDCPFRGRQNGSVCDGGRSGTFAGMATAAPPSLRLASSVVDTAVVGGIDALLRRLSGGRPGASPMAQVRRILVDCCYSVGAVSVAGRTGGQALVRLRVVDELTGGRPGWPASVVWWALRQPPSVLLIPVRATSRLGETARKLEEVRPDVEALKRRFYGDEPGFYRAVGDLYRSRGIRAWRGCGPALVASVLAIAYDWVMGAGIVLRGDRRGLRDRLAGILVVRKPPGS